MNQIRGEIALARTASEASAGRALDGVIVMRFGKESCSKHGPVERRTMRIGAPFPQAAHSAGSWSDDLERLADALHRSAMGKAGASFFRSPVPRAWEPRANVYETPAAFLLCLELAGMSTSEIDVTLDGETLVVSGTRAKPAIPGGAATGSHRVSIPVMEIDSGPFERRIRLSRHIEKGGIEATYTNGFLWITLPKRSDTGETAR